MGNENLKLVYVVPTNVNTNNIYEYDLLFSETPEVVWGRDWDINNMSSTYENILDTLPEKSTYSYVLKIKSKYQLKTIEETSCYSMEYAINGIIALSWINLENLEEYPQNGRCVLHFGDNIEKVIKVLEKSEIITNNL